MRFTYVLRIALQSVFVYLAFGLGMFFGSAVGATTLFAAGLCEV